MAQVLKGAPVAAKISEASANQVEALRERGVTPTLAILRVGSREDDLSYERGAMKRAAAVGVMVKSVVLDEDVSQAQMLDTIKSLNEDASVHGILMFRPLPAQLDEHACCEAIAPEKDVDAATEASIGAVFTGSGRGFTPCTPQACMEILSFYGVDTAGKTAAVIGRSLVVGKPIAMLLLRANATPVICHSKTADMASLCKGADIVVAAIGRCEMLGAEYFSEGQVVIDVGINWSKEKGKLCGDVDFTQAEPTVKAISPVPGGVGGVTTAVLISHVVEAASKACP